MGRLTLVCLLLAGLFFSCLKDQDSGPTVNYIEAGDPLPAFTVGDAGGDSRTSSEIVSGKVSLVMFFVTTCPDCREVLPKLQSVWNTLGSEPDFAMMLISREEKQDAVSRYWQENNFTMPYYLDADRSAFRLFANQTVPRTYITDQNGIVKWMEAGSLEASATDLAAYIRNLLEAPTP